jgi:hypothetical protein
MTPPPGDTGYPMGAREEIPDRFGEDLARYVDNEMSESERAAFEEHLEASTELQREVAIQRAMKGDLSAMGLERPEPPGGSVWDAVNRSIARPTGWIFLIVGALMYVGYAIYTFIESPMNLFERLTIGFVVIGFVILLASVGWERIRDYRTDPYKGVQR